MRRRGSVRWAVIACGALVVSMGAVFAVLQRNQSEWVSVERSWGGAPALAMSVGATNVATLDLDVPTEGLSRLDLPAELKSSSAAGSLQIHEFEAVLMSGDSVKWHGKAVFDQGLLSIRFPTLKRGSRDLVLVLSRASPGPDLVLIKMECRCHGVVSAVIAESDRVTASNTTPIVSHAYLWAPTFSDRLAVALKRLTMLNPRAFGGTAVLLLCIASLAITLAILATCAMAAAESRQGARSDLSEDER